MVMVAEECWVASVQLSKRKSKKDNSYLRKSGGEITEIVSSLEQLSLGGGFHKKLTSMKSNGSKNELIPPKIRTNRRKKRERK